LITPSGNFNSLQIEGRSYVNLPVGDYDIVNKLYVDANYAEAPSSSITNTIALFADNTGHALKGSTVLITSNNQVSNIASMSLTGGTGSVTLSANAASTTYPLILPQAQGASNSFLRNNGSGTLDWATPTGSGNVNGPVSSTTNAVALYFNTTGTIIKNSSVLISSLGDISGVASVQLNGSTSGVLTVQAAAATSNYSVTFPSSQGSNNTYLKNNGFGVLSWDSCGDVTGPSVSTDNAIVRFDLTSGKLIQNSLITINGDISGVASVQLNGSTSGVLTIQAAATTSNYTITMPNGQSTLGTPSSLVNDGTGNLYWSTFEMLRPAIMLLPATYPLQNSDQSKLFIFTTSGITEINFTNSPITLPSGFYCYVKNGTTSDITIKFNGVNVSGPSSTVHKSTGSSNSVMCVLYFNGTNLYMY
jgi:hypothetical protein